LSFFIQTFLSARSKARFLLQLLYKQTIPGAIPFFNILSFLIIFSENSIGFTDFSPISGIAVPFSVLLHPPFSLIKNGQRVFSTR